MEVVLTHKIELDHQYGIIDLYTVTSKMAPAAIKDLPKGEEVPPPSVIGLMTKQAAEYLKSLSNSVVVYEAKPARSAIYFNTNHVVGIVPPK